MLNRRMGRVDCLTGCAASDTAVGISSCKNLISTPCFHIQYHAIIFLQRVHRPILPSAGSVISLARTRGTDSVAPVMDAAAAQQAGQAALQAAIEGTGPRFQKFTRSRRIKKRNQQHSNCWLHSPGSFYFSRSADWDLTDNARARGVQMDDQFVKRIAVGHFGGDDRIYIWATEPNDPDGFDIDRTKDRIAANASEYFFASGLVRKAGVKEKFDLLPADKLIEGGPALCFHLNKPVAAGTFKTSRKKKSTDKNQTPKPDPGKSGAGKSEPGDTEPGAPPVTADGAD